MTEGSLGTPHSSKPKVEPSRRGPVGGKSKEVSIGKDLSSLEKLRGAVPAEAKKEQWSGYEEHPYDDYPKREAVAEDSELSSSGRTAIERKVLVDLPSVIVDEKALGMDKLDASGSASKLAAALEGSLNPADLPFPKALAMVEEPPAKKPEPPVAAKAPAKKKGLLSRLFGKKEAPAPEPKRELSRLEEDMPAAELEAIGDAFAKGFEGDKKELKAQVAEAVKEVKEASPENRLRILKGILNMGVTLSALKSEGMAYVAGKVKDGATDEGSFMNRLLGSTQELYARRGESSRKLIEDRAKVTSVAGALKGGAKIGSLLSWGRTVADLVQRPIGFASRFNPLRGVTTAAMMFGTSAEISKEARLKNSEVREKTRVKDLDTASAEAWAIYEQAEKAAKGKPVTKEALAAAYADKMPADILKRLNATPEGVAGGLMRRILTADLAGGVRRIENKLLAIEGNPKLSDEQKAAQRAELVKKYEGFLRDADRMAGQASQLDLVAYGARLAEKAGKTVVTVMAFDTVARLFLSGMDAFEHHFGSLPEAAPVATAAGTGVGYEVMTAESRDPGHAIVAEVLQSKMPEEHPSLNMAEGHFSNVKNGSTVSGLVEGLLKKDTHKGAYDTVVGGGFWKKGGGMDYQLTTKAVKDGLNVGIAETTDGHTAHVIMRGAHGEVFYTPQEAAAAGYLKVVDHGGHPSVPEYHDSKADVLSQVGKREASVTHAVLGEAADKLSAREQQEIGRQLMVVQRDYEKMQAAGPGAQHDKYQALFKADIQKLNEEHGKVLPKDWSNRLRTEGLAAWDGKPVEHESTPVAPEHEESNVKVVEKIVKKGDKAAKKVEELTKKGAAVETLIPPTLQGLDATPIMDHGAVVGFDHAAKVSGRGWEKVIHFTYGLDGQVTKADLPPIASPDIEGQLRELASAEQAGFKEDWMANLPKGTDAMDHINLRHGAEQGIVDLVRRKFYLIQAVQSGLPQEERAYLAQSVTAARDAFTAKYGAILSDAFYSTSTEPQS